MKSRNWVPVVYVLWAILLGYTLHNLVAGGLAWGIVEGAFLIMGGLVALKLNRVGMVIAWVGLVLTAGSWAHWHLGNPKVKLETPREAKGILNIKKLYPNKFGKERHYGLGEFHPQELHYNLDTCERVVFSLKHLGKIKAGATYEVAGVISPLEKQNAYQQGLKRRGYLYQLKQGKLLQETKGAPIWKDWAQSSREHLKGILSKGWHDDSNLGAYWAMTLGDKGGLTEDNKHIYAMTGTLHLFAISGLHVGVIAGFIYALLKYFPVRVRTRAILGLATVGIYVLITGAEASAVRAYLMILFFWGGTVVYRKPIPLTAWALSAICVLSMDPGQLWNVSFQLSYTVVGAIILWGLPGCELVYNQWIEPLESAGWRRFWSYISSLVIISVVATTATMPLTAYYFGSVTPGGIWINPVILPLAGVIITLGGSSVVLSWVPGMSYLLNTLALGLLSIQNILLKAFAQRWGYIGITQQYELVLGLTVLGMLALGHEMHRCNVQGKVWYYAISCVIIIVSLALGH